jgi:hypothetical protein
MGISPKEKKWLGVFENRVLRKTFWPERDEVTGKWKLLYSEEFPICTHHQTLFR